MENVMDMSGIPDLSAGIGLRSGHYDQILACRPAVGFLEIHAENYFCGGPAARRLRTFRETWPISVHGVGLSLGSADGVDDRHLERLAALVERIDPTMVSEHLTWSVADAVYLNDLVPLPYTEEALAVVVTNIDRVQSHLKRRILIENPSAYLRFAQSVIPEAEFLAALVERTGCGILCDVNNIYVTTRNLGGDPLAWLKQLPASAVGEIHLAGHTVNVANGVDILIDDHGSRVCEPVWSLYAEAVQRFPSAPALVEWDTRLPELNVLVAEAHQADARRASVLNQEPCNAVAA